MGSFIKKIIGFGMVCLAVYLLVLFIWTLVLPKHFAPNVAFIQGAYGHMNSRMKEVKEVKNVDVLFLGSSHAYRDLDPRIFLKSRYSSFNLGSSAQTPEQTKVLVHRYIDQLNPKLVILEMSPKVFSKDGVESALDIISNDENDWYSFIMAWELKNVKVLNTYFYVSIRQLFSLDQEFKEPIQRKEDTYVSGGYVEKELQYFEYQDLPQETLAFNSSLLESVDEILDQLKKRDIAYVFISAPIASATYKSYTENEKFDNIMEQYAPYYNFNEIMSLDDSLFFYNAQHLNQVGVERFNGQLIEVLKPHLPK